MSIWAYLAIICSDIETHIRGIALFPVLKMSAIWPPMNLFAIQNKLKFSVSLKPVPV